MLPIRWTIFRRGLLLISLPLALQLLFAAYLLKAQRDAVHAERMSLHSKAVISTARDAYAHLVEAQAATRGYVITSNPMFQTLATDAEKATREALTQLQTLTSDNQSQQAKVTELIDRTEALKRWYVEQRLFVSTGRQQDAIERVQNLEGKKLLDQVRIAREDFLTEEQKLNEIRLDAVRAASRQQLIVLAGGLFAGIIVTGVAVTLFGRSIGSRIEIARQNAVRLSEGTPLLKPVEGDDEIGQLDKAMHEASRRLADSARTEQQYKQELEQRASDLARTNENLRQQTQENEMFVYSVSHDLRSPLVNLQGFSRELLHAGEDLKIMLSDERVPEDVRRRADDLLEQDMVSSVKFIQTAVSRSGAIIDALLRLSRAGRVEYRMGSVDVGGIVRRVVDAMQDTITQKDAEILLHDLSPAFGDATAIEQIFGNLVGNAVNYLDPSRRGYVEIGMVNQGEVDGAGMVTYFVRDNGLGIPSAYLGKVFVAFQRLHGEVAKGEGIGLALVRRIIERHNGRAWVESTVGVGTTFFVSLPSDRPLETEGKHGTQRDFESHSIPTQGAERDSARNEALV